MAFASCIRYIPLLVVCRDSVNAVNTSMHAELDLRVVLEWAIAGSGSVIADVIRLNGDVSLNVNTF